MVENSFREGLLINVETKPTTAARRLCMYWGAVQEVYPEAWGAPPRKSQLTHGTGIASTGYLMDAIATRQGGHPSKREFRGVLETLGPLPWMEGSWKFSTEFQLPWDELQNTGHHIDMLTNHLIRRYRKVQ